MKVNPKNFTLIKFLLTVGLIGFYINSLVAFLNIFKNEENKLNLSLSTYLIIQISIFVFTIICFVSFFTIRFNIHKKLQYQYNKKEKKYFIVIFTLLGFLIVFTLLNIVTFSFYFKNIIYLILGFGIVQLIFGVSISILENFARLNEQAIVNKAWFVKNQEENSKKEANKEVEESKKIKENKEKEEKNEKILLNNKEEYNPFLEEDEND